MDALLGKGEKNMKYISAVYRKIAYLLFFILFFLSFFDENHEPPTFSDVPCLGREHTSALPVLLEADSGIIPDFLSVEETHFSTQTAIINRVPTRRQAGSRTFFTAVGPVIVNTLCIFLTAFFYYFTIVFHQSRQFIIRYIHDKDGEKNTAPLFV